jgi:hypothetical protein
MRIATSILAGSIGVLAVGPRPIAIIATGAFVAVCLLSLVGRKSSDSRPRLRPTQHHSLAPTLEVGEK